MKLTYLFLLLQLIQSERVNWITPIKSGFYPADINSESLIVRTEEEGAEGAPLMVAVMFYNATYKYQLGIYFQLPAYTYHIMKCMAKKDRYTIAMDNVPKDPMKTWHIRKMNDSITITCNDNVTLEFDMNDSPLKQCKETVIDANLKYVKFTKHDNATVAFKTDSDWIEPVKDGRYPADIGYHRQLWVRALPLSRAGMFLALTLVDGYHDNDQTWESEIYISYDRRGLFLLSCTETVKKMEDANYTIPLENLPADLTESRSEDGLVIWSFTITNTSLRVSYEGVQVAEVVYREWNEECVALMSRALVRFVKVMREDTATAAIGVFTPARHMDKLLDVIPPGESKSSYLRLLAGRGILPDAHEFVDVLTAPATKILDRWFESEPLRATLATDAVIGAWQCPSTPGSSYVLLHHVMGGVGEREGAWAYVEGGMGGVSNAIAKFGLSVGLDIKTDAEVQSINVHDNKVEGVTLSDGTILESKVVLSNATPKVTMLDLLTSRELPNEYLSHIKSYDYRSPVFKLNVALDRTPKFSCLGNGHNNTAGPQHQGTIHLNSETTDMVDAAFNDACRGNVSERPVLELTIPSSVDPTLAPPGHHCASLFIQYVPYCPNSGPWNQQSKDEFVKKVFNQIDEYAPGFSDSVVGYDALAPPDLEEIFGLTGGNIFHGSMGLDQLFTQRPSYLYPAYTTPLSGLFLCGSGTHPGGGVMGAPGRNCASVALKQRRAFGM